MYRGLQGLSLPVSQGLVWTTDAHYRETVEEPENFTKGALAVEMQAASLFAFARARHANVAVVTHVTNAIDQTRARFDKGSDEHGWETVQAMCRARERFWISLSDDNARMALSAVLHPAMANTIDLRPGLRVVSYSLSHTSV